MAEIPISTDALSAIDRMTDYMKSNRLIKLSTSAEKRVLETRTVTTSKENFDRCVLFLKDGDEIEGASGHALTSAGISIITVASLQGFIRSYEERTKMKWYPQVGLLSATCLMRSRQILQSAFTVEIVPMRCYPDPDIHVEYVLECVCNYDECDRCHPDMCSCMQRQYEVCTHVDGGRDPLKVALLTVAWKAAQQSPNIIDWVCVYGGDNTGVANMRVKGEFTECGFMPSSSIVFGAPGCTGMGVAYLRVSFPDKPQWNFVFAVTGIVH